MVVTTLEHAFRAFERMHCVRDTAMIIVNRMLPIVCNVLWSHGPRDPNQSESYKFKAVF